MKPPIEWRPNRERVVKPQAPRAREAETPKSLSEKAPVEAGSTVDSPSASTAPFDRVAYQREYMRRYRAKKKGGA